jgi:hypothetical protein
VVALDIIPEKVEMLDGKRLLLSPDPSDPPCRLNPSVIYGKIEVKKKERCGRQYD